MQNIFYVAVKDRKEGTAATNKASTDIEEICRRGGYKALLLLQLPGTGNVLYKNIWKFWYYFYLTHKFREYTRSIPENAVVFFQYPMTSKSAFLNSVSKMQAEKHAKLVCLIHDLRELQGRPSKKLKDRHIKIERKLFSQCDCLICHNEKMKEYMVKNGLDSQKIVCLEIFDYLENGHEEKIRAKSKYPTLAIAGKMNSDTSEYLYKMFEYFATKGSKLTGNLYGPGFDASRKTANMHYCGSFPAGEIPRRLEGDFGLVWYGSSIKTCAGNFGEYSRYNCPHKVSLYLTAGMPVIIWSKAAMADFIVKNGAGLTVDSLQDVEEAIQSIDEKSYARMCENARSIGARLREGYYFKKAMDEALARIAQA